MAHEVYTREQQVKKLRIELDKTQQQKQVAEITETEYFQQLQNEAQSLRDIVDGFAWWRDDVKCCGLTTLRSED